MSDSIVLAGAQQQMQTALQSFASALSKLADEEVPKALDMAKQLYDLSEEMKNNLRDRALAHLQSVGERITEKGSLQSLIGGYKVVATPTRTGLDPKKLEVALRRRGLGPTSCMNASITYKVDVDKVAILVDTGKLTADDLAACQYDPSFRVSVEPL